MKRLALLLFGCLLPALGQASAPSCTGSGSAMVCTVAVTNTQQDILDAIAQVDDGGKVVIRPGTVSITSTIFTGTKGYTLQGATTCDSTTGICSDTTGTQFTTFQDDIVGSTTAKITPVITINTPLTSPEKAITIRGITFDSGQPRAGAITDDGTITIQGGGKTGMCHKIRITNCHFKPDGGKQSRQIQIRSGCWGVADHNVFDNTGQQHFSCRMSNWPYPSPTPSPSPAYATPNNGDGSWEQPTNFGSEEFFFFEDNYFNDTVVISNGKTITGYSDATEGGRFVFRFNHCLDTQNTTHGTFGNRFRGTRAVEMYGNEYRSTLIRNNGAMESGTALIFDNSNITELRPGSTTQHYVAQTGWNMQSYRIFAGSASWGGATGFSAWDINDTTNSADHPNPETNPRGTGSFTYTPVNGIYATGAVATASPSPGTNNNPQTLTVTDTVGGSPVAWATDQFFGFVITKNSNLKSDYPCDQGAPPFAAITPFLGSRNAGVGLGTGDTINVGSYTDGDQQCCWKPDDTFKIARPLVLLDQPGRGQCHNHIEGDTTPVNTSKGTQGGSAQGTAWPDQDLEPIYEWNNGNKPSPSATPSSYVHMQPASSNIGYLAQNTDYYNYNSTATTSGTNQTADTRRGTHSNRPNQCSPGVAYWETDTGGDWNKTNGTSQDGRLFVCGPANTWTAAYTPYTYPHTLISTTPAITSTATQFTANSSTNQQFQVQTTNFTNPSTIDFRNNGVTSVPVGATPNQLPNGVSFSTGVGGGKFSGFATGAIAGDYHITIQAIVAVPTQSDTQDFVLTIISPNAAPTITSFDQPPAGSTWSVNSNVPISVTAHDDSSVASVKFFIDANTTPIATITIPPYDTTWNAGSVVPISVGPHTIKATATDGEGAIGNGTVNITVSATPTPAVTPTPPQIRVSQ